MDDKNFEEFKTIIDQLTPDARRDVLDYSIFVGLMVGIVMGTWFVVLLVREWRSRRRQLRDAAVHGQS
jgi:hypothetical protein